MNRRIWINVAFFALLGVVLSAWAATSLLKLDVIAKPFPVTAEFASSPGLFPDLQVSYLGVPVGRVASVELRPGKVAVEMEIDHDARIPAGVGAQVLRKSAIGEPYIELTAPKTSGEHVLKAGDTVPLARTSATVDYQELFTGLGDTLDAVDPADTGTVVHELSAGLNGRADTLHDLIGDADQLTSTLASNAQVFDRLGTELTGVTGTLAAHRMQLRAAAGDLADVTAEVSAASGDLKTVLEKGPDFLKQVDALLEKSRPGLDCLLTAGAVPGPSVFNAQTEQSLRHVLTLLPTFQALVKDISVVTPQATYLRATALVSIAGPKAAADYAKPAAQPTWSTLPTCKATPGRADAVAKPSDAPRAPDAPAQSVPNGFTTAPAQRVSADGASGLGSAPLLLILGAGAVLALVAARFLRTYLTGRKAGR
ncbi:hypothetical protein GCM10022221_27970 [Actinocorallia aurea]